MDVQLGGQLPAGDQPEYLMADMDAVAAREVLARLLRLHRAGPGAPRGAPRPSSRFVGSPATSTHIRRASRDDRLFPPEFDPRVARTASAVDEIPGGHLVALSGPVEPADRLESSLAVTNPVPA